MSAWRGRFKFRRFRPNIMVKNGNTTGISWRMPRWAKSSRSGMTFFKGHQYQAHSSRVQPRQRRGVYLCAASWQKPAGGPSVWNKLTCAYRQHLSRYRSLTWCYVDIHMRTVRCARFQWNERNICPTLLSHRRRRTNLLHYIIPELIIKYDRVVSNLRTER